MIKDSMPAPLNQWKELNYGSIVAQLFLWQKALLLAPIWAILIIPVLGLLCRGMGSFAYQFGFGIVLALSALYFIEDMLKRKIRMNSDYIFFGFRSIPIDSIVSADMIYKKNSILPVSLLINYDSGKSLKLNLSGLSEQGVETLIKGLQLSNSKIKTAAVINTLIKCRTNKAAIADQSETLALAYNSRRFILESFEVFKSTAAKWIRVGPILACVLSEPIWMSWLSNLYNCLAPRQWYASEKLNPNIFFSEFFANYFGHVNSFLRDLFNNGQSFAAFPLISILTIAFLSILSLYLIRLVCLPNQILMDKKGLKLLLRFADLKVCMASIDWNSVVGIKHLHSGTNSAGKLCFELNKGKKLSLDLSLIAEEERALLVKRLEKALPTVAIDAGLTQSMLAKANRSYTELWLQSLSQAPERQNLDPLGPGQVVGEGRFEVLRTIGVGGQGSAYLCADLSRNCQQVVLKETIVPVFAERNICRKAIEGFEKEAVLLKSLDFPGVVKLLDYFVEDHRAYLVLEHIDGRNLRDIVLESGPFSEEQVRDLAAQMSEILSFLHANSIVHRDFTPDNLILDSKGCLKLIDFNVAQQIKEGNSGTIVGKHAYLPPEQFRGKATNQSDLYAMGASLYFLLCGQDPEPISCSSARKHNPQLSGAIDEIIKKATALNLKHRYQCVEELKADLFNDKTASGNDSVSGNGDLDGDESKSAKQDFDLASSNSSLDAGQSLKLAEANVLKDEELLSHG